MRCALHKSAGCWAFSWGIIDGAVQSLPFRLQVPCLSCTLLYTVISPLDIRSLSISVCIWLQGLTSSDVLLSTLCTSALLSLEGLVHPRATPPAPTHPLPTQLNPSSNPHSYTGPPKDGESLGMPRMWTPIHPDWAVHEDVIPLPAALAPISTGQSHPSSAAHPHPHSGPHSAAREDLLASDITMAEQQPADGTRAVDPLLAGGDSTQVPGLPQPQTVNAAASAVGTVPSALPDGLGESAEQSLRIPAERLDPVQPLPSLAEGRGPIQSDQPGGNSYAGHHPAVTSQQQQQQQQQQLQQPKILLPGFEGAKNVSIFGVDSSDSEGPMPEIDSGSDDDDDMDESSEGDAA